MASDTEHLDVRYCEGWDPRSRTIVGPLPVAAARQRDNVGKQYAVLLGSSVRPSALIEVAWQSDYAAVWFFDGVGRREAKHDFRRLTERRLFLLEVVEWEYAGPEQAEFDEAAGVRSRLFSPEGEVEHSFERPHVGLRVGFGEVPVEALWEPAPEFGDWASLARRDRDQPPSLVLIPHPRAESAVPPPPPNVPTAPPPWRPPVPLQPSDLDAMFRAGTRYALDDVGEGEILIRQAGLLRLPSGQVAAADPRWLDGQIEPFTAAIAPGTYLVTLAVIRWEQAPTYERVAAGKLVVRKEPVASWEPALLSGGDLRMLRDGEFYGFGVDSGKACFVDATVASTMARTVPKGRERFIEVRSSELRGDREVGVVGPESAADLISFSSGWGDGTYPTWIGRTADGEVACFVADMLVLHDATVLP